MLRGARSFRLRCNPVQGATATLASTAILAMWILQLTESKGAVRVRIPLSPPIPSFVARHEQVERLSVGGTETSTVE